MYYYQQVIKSVVTKFVVPGYHRCRPWEHRQYLCRRHRDRLGELVFFVHPKIKHFTDHSKLFSPNQKKSIDDSKSSKARKFCFIVKANPGINPTNLCFSSFPILNVKLECL
jgi:hypothetical protein